VRPDGRSARRDGRLLRGRHLLALRQPTARRRPAERSGRQLVRRQSRLPRPGAVSAAVEAAAAEAADGEVTVKVTVYEPLAITQSRPSSTVVTRNERRDVPAVRTRYD